MSLETSRALHFPMNTLWVLGLSPFLGELEFCAVVLCVLRAITEGPSDLFSKAPQGQNDFNINTQMLCTFFTHPLWNFPEVS